MAEWSKALVLGTSLFGGVGSNPTPVIFGFQFFEVVPLLFLGYEVFEKFFEQTKSTATRNRTGDLPRVRRSS